MNCERFFEAHKERSHSARMHDERDRGRPPIDKARRRDKPREDRHRHKEKKREKHMRDRNRDKYKRDVETREVSVLHNHIKFLP